MSHCKLAFGFVEFEDPEDARDAIRDVDGIVSYLEIHCACK